MIRLSIMIFCVIFSCVVQAQPGSIAGSAVVGTLVDSLEQSVASTIQRIDDTVSNNSFRTRQHLEILLSQLDSIADNQRDKTFSQLDQTQQAAFLNIKNSIEQLARLERVTANDAQKTSLTVGTAIGNLPLGNTVPRVIDYSPSYVLASRPGVAPGIVVSISGMLLGEGVPKLVMNDRDCEILSKTETALQFNCAAENWGAPDTVKNISGQLTVYQKNGFFRSLFGKSSIPRIYKLVVFAVPMSMGSYSLTAVKKVGKSRTNQRTQEFASHNDHCAGSREILFPFNGTPGWLIDPASIKVNCSASQASRCDGLRNIATTSFGYMGRVVNYGTCAPRIFGQRAYVDARGAVFGSVGWVETQPYDELVTEDMGGGTLEWDKAVRIPLQAGTQSVSLTVKQIDGKSVIVTSDDLGQSWYTVKFDRQSQFLLVTPRSLDVAMLK